MHDMTGTVERRVTRIVVVTYVEAQHGGGDAELVVPVLELLHVAARRLVKEKT